MKDQVTIQVDKSIADAIGVLQILRDCGVIDVNADRASFSGVWNVLDDGEKALVSAMVKGSVATLGAMKHLQKLEGTP